MEPKFEWDLAKAATNRRKHGVSFSEATTVFLDPLAATASDPRTEDVAEVRYATIGYSMQGRLLIVAHCERDEAIRIISARKPTRRERTDYEESS